MLKTLFLTSLTLSLTVSLKFKQENKNPFIIPLIKNKITPFILFPESEFDKLNEYKITRTCTPNVQKNLKFEGFSKLLCNGQGLYYHISYLNEFLANLETISKTEEILDDLVIIYNLEFKDSDGFERSRNFHQFIRIIREVPVLILNLKKDFIRGNSGFFRIKVLEIPENYDYSHRVEFTLDLVENQFPLWMNYDFEGNSLFFEGNAPEDLEKGFFFKFVVTDVAVELRSASYTYEFNILKEKGKKNGFHVGWFFFILIVVILGIAGLWFFYKKYKKNKKEIGDEFKKDEKIKKEITGREFNYNVYDGITRPNKNLDDTFEEIKNQKQNNDIDIKFKSDFKNKNVLELKK